MEISLSRGGTVLDKDIQLPLPRKGHISPSTFRPTSIVAKRSPILATAELLFDHAAYRSHQQWDKTLWHSSQDSFRHLGQDSLALLSERSWGHFGTSADLFGQLTKLVPKCPGSEVSVILSGDHL